MRRLFIIALLVFALTPVALAGDVPSPPCTENCPQVARSIFLPSVVPSLVLAILASR